MTIALVTIIGAGIFALSRGPVGAPNAPTPDGVVGTFFPLPSGSALPGTLSRDISRRSNVPHDGSSPSMSPPKGVVVKRVVAARLGIDLPVVEGDGVDAPIGKAAHYPGTGWPNGGTNIYLYGHARDGMFIGLWQAKVGESIDLTLVDGATKTYVVTQVLPKVKWNALQYLDPTPTEQLTLQTSTGPNYTDPKFLVIAVPES